MNNLKSADWIKTPESRQIIAVLGADNARFVGGCVRNALLNIPVTDIDIATIHKPQEVMDILKSANIKAIPTGIDHGTVTALINKTSFEITTLRRDTATDGRHATVTFTKCWLEDAQRRDFTINTLLADINGTIYDPTGQGLDDLKARRVIFVGDPAARIREDFLRILRFFRFYALYGSGSADPAALKACRAHAKSIANLSRERITQEFTKIIMADKASQTLRLMFSHNVLKDFDQPQNWQAFENLCQERTAPIATRLYALLRDITLAERYLILTNAHKKQWKVLAKVAALNFQDTSAIKAAIYHHGREPVFYTAIMQGQGAEITSLIKNWQIPNFPISASDLMKKGYTQGPELGAELKRLEEEWLATL